MCVLLCLSNSCLCHVVCRKEFTKCICNFCLVECNKFIRDRYIVLCETYISCLHTLSSVKSIKRIITKCSCDLSCSVRAEIEENHRILVFDRCNRSPISYNNSRHDKLICLSCIVRFLHCANSTFRLLSFSFYHCIVCKFYTIPSVIAVHCIITSHYRSHFSNTNFFHLVR